jgi:hypothetical protein
LTASVQVHPPLEELVQVAFESVRASPLQSNFVPESIKHPATRSSCG